MPGVAHPKRDGFATHIGKIQQGVTSVSQQQAFPNIELMNFAGAGVAIAASSSLQPVPSPGPVLLEVNAGISLKFLVGLSAVVALNTSTNDIGTVFFRVNGFITAGVLVPLQIGAGSGGLKITTSVGGAYLVDGGAGGDYAGHVTPGRNTFEVLADASSAGVFTIASTSIWAITI